MNEIIANKEDNIESMIYEIRGKQVMLDSDLAKLYHCKNGTKEINQAVMRNIEKFPERFCWRLTEEESKIFLVTICDQKIETRGGKYKNPRVFTEQGIAMLATVLKSKIAIEVSIQIMDAFVSMRHYIVEYKDVYQSLNHMNNKLVEHDEKLNYLFSKFDQKEYLFLPGEVYDAYSEISNVLCEAKEEVIIIDAYADKTLLDYIRDINSKIILITSNKSKMKDIEIDKFNKQYHKLEVIYNDAFHDRYFIIDKKEVFHVGTSLNHIGEKLFSINKLDDKIVKEHLIHYVQEVIKNSYE